jgi:hypothetical protein
MQLFYICYLIFSVQLNKILPKFIGNQKVANLDKLA